MYDDNEVNDLDVQFATLSNQISEVQRALARIEVVAYILLGIVLYGIFM